MENETLIQYMQIVVKWARLHTHEMMYELLCIYKYIMK